MADEGKELQGISDNRDIVKEVLRQWLIRSVRQPHVVPATAVVTVARMLMNVDQEIKEEDKQARRETCKKAVGKRT